MDLFSHLNIYEGRSSQYIARLVATDAVLVSRILRLLASARIISESAVDHFAATNLSSALQGCGYQGGFKHLFAHVLPVFVGLPDFLNHTGYQNPQDPARGPWHHGKNTDQPFFQWLRSMPTEASAFHSLMTEFHELQPFSWVKIYPLGRLTTDVSPDQANPGAPLVVDVGGGLGQDMENLRQALLPAAYQLLVQDLPEVVANVKQTDVSVRFMGHDFFSQQPIQGARAYFLHSVLHDWPDSLAQQILQNLKGAFTPGYSRLLLCENVMPEAATLPLGGALDLVMMGLLCAQERSEKSWRSLLTSAGFRVFGIWGSNQMGQCVIEAEPMLDSKISDRLLE